MIDVLVFSRDRAAQLDLLLRSIGEHAAHLYSRVTVLYVATSASHGLGYLQCESDHAEARFVSEGRLGFAGGVWRWLADAGDPLSFLVDDDVFYRTAPDLDELVERLPVSLRGGDLDYPFSVDGNVYRKRWVRELLEGLPFRDPTELEWFADTRRSRLPFLAVNPCPGRPCLVGVPANRVSPTSGLEHMGVDVDELLDRYLAGERLKLRLSPELAWDLPAHAKLKYQWQPAPPAPELKWEHILSRPGATRQIRYE